MTQNEISIIRLFTDEPIRSCSTANTCSKTDDFREIIYVFPESGSKFVIKLAANSFTTEESIRMWQRCAKEYFTLGYYCPQIIPAQTGTFPSVVYKGVPCIAYAEEYSKYGSAAQQEHVLPFRDELYLMTAKVAAQRFDYTQLPSAYCLFESFPGDETDEVTENAIAFRDYCASLPERFAAQAKRMFRRWEENRAALRELYYQLPFSVFQADFNDTNVLVDEQGKFAGICDFNLAGRDEFLNYLFREIFSGTPEEELNEILRALRLVSGIYTFSEEEIEAAPYIYRCVKPLWYTRVETLKEAGNDPTAIQAILNEMEFAQTREIDFGSAMRK